MGRLPRFFCPTCPYICQIDSKVKIKRRQHLVKKEIEPVISKDDMSNAPQTDATCANCGHGKAAFIQMQMRSADEPMSIFYECLKCRNVWREDWIKPPVRISPLHLCRYYILHFIFIMIMILMNL